MEELLHLLIECRSSDNHLVESSAKCLLHLFADFFLHLLVDNGQVAQQTHGACLQFGEHLLAYDLLDDERYGDDNLRAHVGECLCDDGRRGDAREIVDMAAVEELEDKLECHTVHVGHGQDADDTVAMVDGLAKHMHGEVVVAP